MPHAIFSQCVRGVPRVPAVDGEVPGAEVLALVLLAVETGVEYDGPAAVGAAGDGVPGADMS